MNVDGIFKKEIIYQSLFDRFFCEESTHLKEGDVSPPLVGIPHTQRFPFLGGEIIE